jgi:hypothetical protein
MKIVELQNLKECSICNDKYCCVINNYLKTKCIFCEQECNNIICEMKHVDIFCEKKKEFEFFKT